MSQRIQTCPDKGCGVLRITEASHRSLEAHLYRRYPEREWGTFFRFGWRRTPWGAALTFADGLWPQTGDLNRAVGIVEIRSQYTLRAVDDLQAGPLGIGVIHSHPQGAGTFPSPLDDDMDGYYGELFGAYAPGRPYASVIFSRSQDGVFRFTGRVFLDGEWLPLQEMLICGGELKREDCQGPGRRTEDAPMNGNGEATRRDATAATARLRSFLSDEAGERLRRSTVAVIGCSGTGSPAIEVLARAGVGRFVLVDYQRLSASNLERMHGSIYADLAAATAPFKVELMSRMVREINPDAHVEAIVGNVLDEEVLDALLRADLVLNCTDTQHSRAALGDLAAHYLLPSLDIGVLLEGDGGRVRAQIGQFTWFAPGLPCAFCGQMVDYDNLAYELMSDEEKDQRRQAARAAQERGHDANQYWHGEPPQLLTVGYLTSTLGSLGAGYVIGLLTGKFSMPHSRFQLDLGAPYLGVVEVEQRPREGCGCCSLVGFADQARADRSVSRPSHWPRAVRIEPDHALRQAVGRADDDRGNGSGQKIPGRKFYEWLKGVPRRLASKMSFWK